MDHGNQQRRTLYYFCLKCQFKPIGPRNRAHTSLFDSVNRLFPTHDKYWSHFPRDKLSLKAASLRQIIGQRIFSLAWNERIQIQFALNACRCLTWPQLTRQNCLLQLCFQRLRCSDMVYEFRFTLSVRWTLLEWIEERNSTSQLNWSADGVRPLSLPQWTPHFVAHVFVRHNSAECLRRTEWSFVLIKWKKDIRIVQMPAKNNVQFASDDFAFEWIVAVLLLRLLLLFFVISSLSTLSSDVFRHVQSRERHTHEILQIAHNRIEHSILIWSGRLRPRAQPLTAHFWYISCRRRQRTTDNRHRHQQILYGM